MPYLREVVVPLLCKSIQRGSAQIQTLRAALRGFTIIKIFGNSLSWKFDSMHQIHQSSNSIHQSNSQHHHSPAGIYLFKVNNGSTRAISEICSKLTIKTPELWTDFTHCSGVFIVDFEQVNTSWVSFQNPNLNKRKMFIN